MSANIQVVNVDISRVYENANDNDLVIYTTSSNQSVHLGCGSNDTDTPTMVITRSNTEIMTEMMVGGNIMPSQTLAYDLGSSNMRFRDLYISSSTIDMMGVKVGLDPTTSNFRILDSNNNLKNIIVKEIQFGANAPGTNPMIFKPDDSGTYKIFSGSSSGTEELDSSFSSGIVFANAGLSVSLGSVQSNVPTATVSFVTPSSGASVSYGCITLGSNNGVSLSNNSTTTFRVMHNLESTNYLVHALPDDQVGVQVALSNMQANSFDLVVSNTSGGNVTNPRINYQFIRCTPCNSTVTLVPPVNILSSTGTILTYSGSNSTGKTVTLSNAADSQGYTVTYSLSNDTSGRASISGNSLIYTHLKSSSNAIVTVKARNPYVDDNTKLITYSITETRLNEILSATPSNIDTTQNSTGTGQPANSNLPGTDQGLPLTWATVSESNTLAASINNNSNLTWSSAGTSGTRFVVLNASFTNAIMTEAALAAKVIRINVAESATTFVASGITFHLDFKNPDCYSTSTPTSLRDISGLLNHFTFASNTGFSYDSTGFMNFTGNFTCTGPTSNKFNITTNNTVEIVIQPTYTANSTYSTVLEFLGTSSERCLNIHMPWANGKTYYDLKWGASGGGARLERDITLPITNLRHYVYRYNSSSSPEMHYFENGSSVGSGAGSTNLPGVWGGTSYLFHNNGGTNCFRGKFYMIRIYNRALTNSEILQNYNYCKSRFSIP